MSRKTNFVFKVLQVVSWIIFVGLCIQAGGFIFNTVFTLMFNPAGASKFWTEVDLAALYHFNQSYYVTLTVLMCIVSVLKSVLFYTIVLVFHSKKIDLAQPFNDSLKKFIDLVASISFGIGLFSLWGAGFTKNLIQDGLQMPNVADLSFGGGDVWWFTSVILLVIGQIIKKGIEMQQENELTI
ncbi:DUF2975 domain-containing protein [Flavobacterium turcicum]|uniref:DUF2975 domain-containing protein n=1 Tax=Flavobacterium turcicum TaxID=2764718 RepID=A0ABR7JDF9_9FLAO|nr:DUF2975 domain-containing protein [Flavobacterium turcicum]MBC5862536.1 DUF2975 domain-containing protein [Flavobacterium turcicum]NHL01267.1 DUF2975 domain-containing protein [Flavobacterium turcicum]